VALRRRSRDLRAGAYVSLPAPEGVWAWRRGERAAVALNLSEEERVVEGMTGAVALATPREREGERVAGRLRLGPWEGALLTP
jgi:hypothetical protein